MVLRIQQVAAISMVFLAGCAVKGPMAWRVEGRTLTPPGKPRPIVLRTRAECDVVPGEAIAVRRSGSRAVLTVNGTALGAQQPGWLATWSWRAEESGCVGPGQAPAIAQRILESVPQGLGTAYQALNHSLARSGVVDLGPESRLEVMTPIRRDGSDPKADLLEVTGVTGSGYSPQVAAKASPDLIGVERAWYAVRPEGIVPLRAEARINGVLQARTAPAHNFFEGVHAQYWRLMIKGDESEVFLLAESRRQLVEETLALRDDPEACTKGKAKCLPVPRSVGLNPLVAVNVNGSEVMIPVGAGLRAAIGAAGKKREEMMDVLKTLTITRPFAARPVAVEFDRTKPDVLDLVMLGNETVRW